MWNLAVRASATALPKDLPTSLSRRAALTGALAAIPALAGAAIVTTPSLASPAHPDAGELVLALWARRHALRKQIADAMGEEIAAEARLPAWARSGPQMMAHDGTLCGGNVGWPAIQGMAPPTAPGVLHMVRPGPPDLREKFYRDRRRDELADRAEAAFGKIAARPLVNLLAISTDNALTTFRREWRELTARLRAKTAERERVGQVAAQASIDSLFEKCDAINDEILALAPETACIAAAQILIQVNPDLGSNDPFSHEPEHAGLVVALTFLRPSLSGLLRAHVDEILDNPEMPAASLQAAIGFGDA